MPAFTNIANALVAVGAKPFATTMQALRDNPLAIAEKDVSVPNEYRLGLWLLGAGVTASGTQIDFTGIPARARRVTVVLSGVSGSTTGRLELQLGDSGGIETTGYTGAMYNPPPTASGVSHSTSFILTTNQTSADLVHGKITLDCVDPATNLWVAAGQFTNVIFSLSSNVTGSKALSAALDRVRLLVTAGSFDAGTVNVSWE